MTSPKLLKQWMYFCSKSNIFGKYYHCNLMYTLCILNLSLFSCLASSIIIPCFNHDCVFMLSY
uniref:Structural maintenance of chromosomes protein n=1 Tax=Rhizophora mucronata TaxID=61149 RepID=A0A2P2LWW0_RHIMU